MFNCKVFPVPSPPNPSSLPGAPSGAANFLPAWGVVFSLFPSIYTGSQEWANACFYRSPLRAFSVKGGYHALHIK